MTLVKESALNDFIMSLKRGKCEKKNIRNKKKFSNSKVLKIIFDCLVNRDNTNVVSWKNENKGEFRIKFMNKNNPRWDESLLSLFKKSEKEVSEKRFLKYKKDPKHAEFTKQRFRANINRLVNRKKLERLGIEKGDDNSKYHIYGFVNYGDELKNHLLKDGKKENVRRKKFNKDDINGVNNQVSVPYNTSGNQNFKFTQGDVSYNTCTYSLSIPSPLSSGLGSVGSIASPQSSELGNAGSIASLIGSGLGRAYSVLLPLSNGLGSGFSMPSLQSSEFGSVGSIASPQSSEFGSAGSIASPQSSELGSAGSIASPQSSELGNAGSIASLIGSGLGCAYYILSPLSNELGSGFSMPSPQSSELKIAGSIASPQSSELESVGSIASPQSSEVESVGSIAPIQSSELGSAGSIASPQSSEFESLHSIAPPQGSESGSAYSIPSPQSSELGSEFFKPSPQVQELGSVSSIASFWSGAHPMPSPQSSGFFMPSPQEFELGTTGSIASPQISELKNAGSVESPQSCKFGSCFSFPSHCNELSNGLFRCSETSYSAECSTNEWSACLESLSKDVVDKEHSNTENVDSNAISRDFNYVQPTLNELNMFVRTVSVHNSEVRQPSPLCYNMDFSTSLEDLLEMELDISLHSFEQEGLTKLENMAPRLETQPLLNVNEESFYNFDFSEFENLQECYNYVKPCL